MKLDKKQDLNIPSLCFPGGSEKQDGRHASDWLRHFRLLLCNRWSEFNKTLQKARSQRLLPSLYFLGRSKKKRKKMAVRASDWLRHLRLLLWNNWTNFNKTWQEARSQHHVPSLLCFFGPIWKTRWLPQPLIGWDIFDFFSETTERNSMKLDRKQFNILYQVCVFWANRKNKMVAPASDWLRHFRLLMISFETTE